MKTEQLKRKKQASSSKEEIKSKELFELIKYLIGTIGEFDPGSGRTLAACLTHASRTDRNKKLALDCG